jgi:hypothetical protein
MAVRWFRRCCFSIVISLLACGFATAWFGAGVQLPSATTRDGTLITLNRYAREPAPDVLLVGSSLTYRLKEEYFQTPRLRNLALAGGSALTGLEIVANFKRSPKLILIETNILSRAADETLVQKYWNAQGIEPTFFRPIRTAIALYENWVHAPLTHLQVRTALNQLLEQHPRDFDNRPFVHRALEQLNAEDPSIAVRKNVDQIRELIREFEKRGARVFLMELPYSDEIDSSRSVSITREIVHGTFSEPDRWLRIDVPRNQLRWPDGVHLDERSAAIVTQAIDKALALLL